MQFVGDRLRAIRRQKGLSLHDVEARSRQEFKASVLGAYERGERAISVPRLLRLAVDFDRSAVGDAELAADLFLSLVLGRLSHEALLGIDIDRSAIGGRITAAVKIFLGLGFVAR